MRVLHVIASVAPIYGGPSTAIWPLVKALREDCGFTVDIATTDADGGGGRLGAKDLPPGAGTVQLFKCDWKESFKYSSALSRWLAKHAATYDVIQTHGQWNYPTTAACRAAQKAQVPYIVRPCGMCSPYTWQQSWLKKRLYWWLVERNNVRSADGFHVTSAEERQEVCALGVKVPVDVIPLGLQAEAWSTPTQAGWLREHCPEAGERPIVLFLSRLHPKKGITDFLLPAFAKLRADAFLAIAGGEDGNAPGYASHVENEIGRLNLRGRVQLLGQIPPSHRWWVLDGAALFILPSHAENFGFVVAEAMARGVPVLITSGVQFGEHVIASGGGEVVAPNVDAISQALNLWLDDPVRRKSAGDKARHYVQRTLTWQQTAEKLGKLYHQVLTRANGNIRTV